MKILQVVTYISPDGAYGGPVRVAINQAKALTEQGHDVLVAAAASGFDGALPTQFDGYPVTLFPGYQALPRLGFAGLTSPGLFMWLVRAIHDADVVHVHLARDFVTLPAAALALRAKKPLVVQTHGMIDRTSKQLAKPLDALLTKPILRKAATVLYLTAHERQELREVGGTELVLQHLTNAVQLPMVPAVEQANGYSPMPEVLYLARMHPRKRPDYVVHAAKNLEKRHPNARFTLVGPDEGAAQLAQSIIQRNRLHEKVKWCGPLPPNATLDCMRKASIYVLPSVDEPFPMSVLEAMSLGLPVVITDSCGLASAIQDGDAGVVCGPSQDEFTQSVNFLLENTERRLQMGANARQVVEKNYGLLILATRLIQIYKSASA